MNSLDFEQSPKPRTSATPIIIVGLTLAIVLAVRIATLAASVPPTRGQLHNGIILLEGLNSFEASLEALEEELIPSELEDKTGVESRIEAARLQADAVGSAMTEVINSGANLQDADIANHLQALNESTTHLLVSVRNFEPSDVQTAAKLYERFENLKSPVEADLRATNASIHDLRADLSNSLIGKWQEVVTLAALAVLLSVGFAVAMLLRFRSTSLQRERVMAQIRESREQFRLLAENAPGVTYMCKNDERYTMMFISKSVERVTGHKHEEFATNRISFTDLFHPDDAPKIAPQVNAALAERQPFRLQYRLRHKSGEWRWIEEVGVGVFRGDDLDYLEGFINDVTQRHLAEQKLVQQREYLRQVIDLDPNLIFAKDREGRFTLVNRALAEMYGTTVEDLTNKTDADFNSNAEEVANFRRDDLEVMESGGKFIPEEMVTDSQGRVHWFQTHKRPILNEQGDADQVLGIATDITGLKRAEHIRTGRNLVLERIANGTPLDDVLDLLVCSFQDDPPSRFGAILLFDDTDDTQTTRVAAAPSLDPAVREALVNCDREKVLSCGQVSEVGQRMVVADLRALDDSFEIKSVLLDAGYRCCWSQVIRSETDAVLGAFMFFGTEPCKPEPYEIEILESAAKIAAIAVQRDLAEIELRNSQVQLRAADRLASIGTLTAGLGHDMNNILFPLKCRLDAIDWPNIPPQYVDVLRSTRDTVNYLHQLTEGLRLLSADPNRADASTATTVVNEWWSQVSSLIYDALPRDSHMTSDIEPNLPPIAVAPHRLTQAILNLAVNAAEATDDGSAIEVRAHSIDDGAFVELEVIDSGCGMTEDVKARALDPFFTTKTRALSTGLGLSLVHGVVKGAGGKIDIQSTPGKGTVVSIQIPAAKPVDSGVQTVRTSVVTLQDRRIAGWLTSVLAIEGYNIVQASNEETPEGDLWITDPRDENLELALRFLKRSSHGQILVLGDASSSWNQPGVTIVRTTDDLSSIKSAVRSILQRAERENHVQ